MRSLEDQISGRCVHFTGIMDKKCKAGVEYESFPQPRFKTLPCLKGTSLCDKCQFPTPEEVKAEVDGIKSMSDSGIKVLLAAKAHYKKMGISFSMFTCPICGKNAAYTVASNGHFAVSCDVCKISMRE